MSVFKGEHLYQVLTLLTPAERPAAASHLEDLAKSIAKPQNFRVHTSHVAADDLEKAEGVHVPEARSVACAHISRWEMGWPLVAMVASGLLKHLVQQDPVLLLRLRQLLDLVHHCRMPQIFSGAAQPLGLLDQRLLSLCLPRQLCLPQGRLMVGRSKDLLSRGFLGWETAILRGHK